MNWEKLKALDLKIYSSPWCSDCKRLKGEFDKQGVPFVEVDIDADAKAADYLFEKTGKKAIPYIEINGTHIIRGWHKDAPGRWDDEIFFSEIAEALGH